MKKVATALALAFAFAAPLAFSSAAVQASPVKSQPHITKAVNGKHTVKEHQSVKSMKKTPTHKVKVRKNRKAQVKKK